MPIKRDPRTGQFASGGQPTQVDAGASLSLNNGSDAGSQIQRCGYCEDTYLPSQSTAERDDLFCSAECESESE